MKPQIALSPEQMRELESLGLDCSDASMCWCQEPNENERQLYVHDEYCYEAACLRPIPAYTLEDIIHKTNADILFCPIDKGVMEWRCQVQGSEYDDFNYFNGIGNTPLDAAFVMLKYAIKEHPDKIKRL